VENALANFLGPSAQPFPDPATGAVPAVRISTLRLIQSIWALYHEVPPTKAADRTMSTTMAAVRDPVAMVFNTTELLEHILLYLAFDDHGEAVKTLLFSQRVNKKFQAVIEGSRRCQHALLFQEPDHNDKHNLQHAKALLQSPTTPPWTHNDNITIYVRTTTSLHAVVLVQPRVMSITEVYAPIHKYYTPGHVGGSWERMILPKSGVSLVRQANYLRGHGDAADARVTGSCGPQTTLGELLIRFR
jgi:hypothetical protein